MINEISSHQNYTITFETRCYENDYCYILNGNYLKVMIDRCIHKGGVCFNCRQLIINNVKDRDAVAQLAQKKVDEGVIDRFYFAEDTSLQVLDFFGLTAEDLGKGYVYSISELTGLYMCETDFLLHFSSDAFATWKSAKSHWIEKSIAKMNGNEKYVCATLTWNNLYIEAKQDNLLEGDNGEFYFDHGFSDQCYLVKTSVFRGKIYSEKNAFADSVYPAYGGDLFEKRCSAYFRNKNLYRLVFNKASYIHSNFPKNDFKRNIYYFLSKKLHFEFTTLGRDPNAFSRMKKIVKKKLKAICRHQ